MRWLKLLSVIFLLGCRQTADLRLITDEIQRSELQLLHNKERCLNKAEQVKYCPVLEHFAQKWAEKMAKDNKLYHSKLENNNSYEYLGENIAKGQSNVDEVIEEWMNSKDHRNNILDKNYTYMGCGYARKPDGSPFWCVIFGGN